MPQKIKILFYHRSMEIGGVEKVLINQLKNIDLNIFEVTLLLKTFQGEMKSQIPSNIDLKFLSKGKEDFSRIKPIYYLQLIIRNLKLRLLSKIPYLIRKFYLKKDFDIIVAPTYSSFDDVLNNFDKNSRKVAWFHTDIRDGKDHVKNLVLLNKLKKFDWVVFGSNQTRDVIKDNYDISYPKSQVIYNPMDINGTRQKAEEFEVVYNSSPTFVSVGRLNKRKGYHTLMQAHRNLLNKGINHTIIIIGDGEEKNNLKNKIKELNVENSFILYGSKTNPYPYIKAADFYILSSDSESYPMTIGEVLILGKPIISTNVGGISEMITQHENGLLIEYSEVAMEDAIKTFISDKDFVDKIISNNKTIDQKFDNKIIHNQIEQMFKDLTKK
ncbi:glycosyltransferase [Chryseobacterium oryzae]|uniref:Glycosyltransferase n=1 Tax=Chryseobacterium oryzae TaxID=2929799 RepID=A0ABY4BGJ3_9FLAO|nr:glycosyltransferase [Chryseobacterium oryzae]UOE38019.1 glycosyltransferase [Chryseobacterium oryzae]